MASQAAVRSRWSRRRPDARPRARLGDALVALELLGAFLEAEEADDLAPLLDQAGGLVVELELVAVVVLALGVLEALDHRVAEQDHAEAAVAEAVETTTCGQSRRDSSASMVSIATLRKSWLLSTRSSIPVHSSDSERGMSPPSSSRNK